MKKLVVLFAVISVYNLNAQDTASVEYTFAISDEFNNSQELIIGKDFSVEVRRNGLRNYFLFSTTGLKNHIY